MGITDYTFGMWGPEQAAAYVDGLNDCLGRLAEQPQMGRDRGEFRTGLRSFRFESHIVYYVATRFGISVVRILHGRQDPVRRFKP